MPAWDSKTQHWQLFYVQYRAYGTVDGRPVFMYYNLDRTGTTRYTPHARTHARSHTHMHMQTHTHTHTLSHAHAHTHMHTHTHTHVYKSQPAATDIHIHTLNTRCCSTPRTHIRVYVTRARPATQGAGHEQDPNWNGEIMHAVSSVAGRTGIGGPYNDVGVVLKPDNGTQPWEGLQGTDSISPPFLLPDNSTWAAFYGSSGTMGQRNGLVTAKQLGGQFARKLPTALTDFNDGTARIPTGS